MKSSAIITKAEKYTSIIKSKAKLGDIGLGNRFQLYYYNKTVIKITLEAAEEMIYFNNYYSFF